MQSSIRKFLRWEDAQLGLFGKIVLIEGLKQLGIEKDALENIRYTPFNRPYSSENIDFNISHSGQVVVCAISRNHRVGIDIEKIRSIDIHEFAGQFNTTELSQIHQAQEPLHEFYNWWTKKESVIKAEGKGLSMTLKDIIFKSPLVAETESCSWYLYNLAIDEDYCCHLATDCKDEVQIKVERIILD